MWLRARHAVMRDRKASTVPRRSGSVWPAVNKSRTKPSFARCFIYRWAREPNLSFLVILLKTLLQAHPSPEATGLHSS